MTRNFLKVFNSTAVLAVLFLFLTNGEFDRLPLQASVISDIPSFSSQSASAPEDTSGVSLAVVQGEQQRGSWILIEGKPGASFEGAVKITNLNTQKTLVGEIYAVDVNANDAGFAPSARGQNKNAASWVKISDDLIELAPKESQEIPFSGTIPLSATPGQHAFAIMAESKSQAAQSGSKQQGNTNTVTIGTRVGVRAYVTVLGKIVTQGNISDTELVQRDPFIFRTVITNTGNTILRTKTKTVIRDWNDKELENGPAEQSVDIQPTGKVNVDTRWEYSEMGIYSVTLTIGYDGGKEQIRTLKVIIWPSRNYIIIAAIILLLLAMNLFFFFRRRKNNQTPLLAGIPVNSAMRAAQPSQLKPLSAVPKQISPQPKIAPSQPLSKPLPPSVTPPARTSPLPPALPNPPTPPPPPPKV